MLSTSMLENFLNRIGMENVDINIVKSDDYGDYLESFDSEIDFKVLKNSILSNRSCRDYLVDLGLRFVELRYSEYVDGVKVNVGLLCTEGDLGYGVTLKMVVKSIEYYYRGNRKVFLETNEFKRFVDKNSEELT